MIIGICGKSGSGKTTLANKITELIENTVQLDIDKVGHEVLLLDEVKNDLKNKISPVVVKDNVVDRKALSTIVFSFPTKMELLTEITWKHMQVIINKFLEDNQDKNIILDWQLLPKTELFNKCDITILLDIPYEERLKRTLQRDNITPEDFQIREQASLNHNFKRFTYILHNDEEINQLLDKLKKDE